MNSPIEIGKGVGIGALTGVCVGLGGFVLADIPRTRGMGAVLFVLVPVCAGFAIALVTRYPSSAWAATWLAVLVSLVILVGLGREGLLCAILASPLLAAGLTAGVLLGFLFRKYVLRKIGAQGTTTAALLLVTPGIILIGHQFERSDLDSSRSETISNTVMVHASPEEVWSNIHSIDSIDARKPFLMHFGLPVPLRCTLERPGVGAKRTCFFQNGFIEETITAWNPPSLMRLSIDRTNLPGRHWLGFENAEYELLPEGSATRVTRTTTITSHLYPVWYWRYFERLGVSSEHEYILNSLANRFPE